MPVLSDHFGLTRVINLPDRTDRYREVSQQLAELGMGFTPGKVEIYAATRPTELAGFPSLGARGCYLSHLAILRDARDRGVESVLVMEDDCEILPKNLGRVARVAEELRGREWGFVHLGHIESLPEGVAPDAEPTLIEFDGPVQTAHLYGVHGRVLGPLVEYLEACLLREPGDPEGGPMHVDGAFAMFRTAHPEVVTLLAQPNMAVQRSSRSDITFRSFEQVPGLKQAMGFARRLRRRLKAD